MATASSKMLTSTLLFLLSCQLALSWDSWDSWDNDDLEIFDLVEEFNETFYEVIGVEKTATTAQIKKAFRKITLKYHPDKNDEPNAEERFRQFLSVYEVLKDEKKREKYNKVLVEGLPTWRMPVYYYRRARKMSMIELTIVLSLIATIGQYCVAWGVYAERYLVMSSRKKRKNKKGKSSEANEEFDLPSPRLMDLWPIQFPVFIFSTVYNLPSTIREWKEERQFQKEEEERLKALEEKEKLEAEEEARQRKEFLKKAKKKAQPELPEYSEEMYAKFSMPSSDGSKETQGSLAEELEKASQMMERFGEEWTDEELVLLAKAVKKFPGGTADRWEKIADMVGRSVIEVTNKAKETKDSSFTSKISPTIQGANPKGKSQIPINDDIITHNLEAENDFDNDYYSSGKVRKRKKGAKKDNPDKILISQSNETMKIVEPSKNDNSASEEHTASASSSNDTSSVEVKTNSTESWTQNQQTILEWALKQYPKGTDRRWDRVAEHIPGKTKEECIARFKELAELISQKKKLEFVSKAR